MTFPIINQVVCNLQGDAEGKGARGDAAPRIPTPKLTKGQRRERARPLPTARAHLVSVRPRYTPPALLFQRGFLLRRSGALRESAVQGMQQAGEGMLSE